MDDKITTVTMPAVTSSDEPPPHTKKKSLQPSRPDWWGQEATPPARVKKKKKKRATNGDSPAAHRRPAARDFTQQLNRCTTNGGPQEREGRGDAADKKDNCQHAVEAHRKRRRVRRVLGGRHARCPAQSNRSRGNNAGRH